MAATFRWLYGQSAGMALDDRGRHVQEVQEFAAAGLGREASSWVSTGHNLPISAEQLGQVLGQGNLRTLGEQFNVSADSVSAGLASLLPALIDHLTPKGQIDSETPLTASLSALRGRFTL